MVGLNAHTIRAWERRFAAVAPVRTHSGQRRYRLEDVETLKRIKDLANTRRVSLRVAVAEITGDLPELGSVATNVTIDREEGEPADGGVWRVFADLDARVLVILDGRGCIVDANVAFARVAGALRFELPGRRFSELVDPYDRAKAVAIYRGTPQRRSGWELNLRTATGAGLYSFECHPFQHQPGFWLVACAGHRVG
jgi:PAS domain-containing protein